MLFSLKRPDFGRATVLFADKAHQWYWTVLLVHGTGRWYWPMVLADGIG